MGPVWTSWYHYTVSNKNVNPFFGPLVPVGTSRYLVGPLGTLVKRLFILWKPAQGKGYSPDQESQTVKLTPHPMS